MSHGGIRSGAGRPKSEDTIAVRVPAGCIEPVRELIASYRKTGHVPKPQSLPEDLRIIALHKRESELCQSERNAAFRAVSVLQERLAQAGLSTDYR